MLNNLNLNNKFGNKVNELIKAKIIAIDVKSPNKSVGKKLESMSMQKPAEIVVAV